MGADMITDYLDALRVRLRSRRDVDDLVAEVEDHLRAHVDALVREGNPEDEASRLALESFGDGTRTMAIRPRTHRTTTAFLVNLGRDEPIGLMDSVGPGGSA